MKQNNIITGSLFNLGRLTINYRILLGQAIIFDLLMLPYLQWVILPLSLPLVLLALVIGQHIHLPKDFLLILGGLLACVVLSVAISFILPQSQPHATENFMRLMQFATSFAYFIFYYDLAKRYGKRAFNKKIFYTFIIYFFVLSILFFLDPAELNKLLSNIYGRLVASEDVAMEHFRFAYFFTDPNTAAYFLLIAGMPLLYFVRSALHMSVILLMLTVAVLITQSRGGLLALVLGIIVWVLPWQVIFKITKKNLQTIFWLTGSVVSVFIASLWLAQNNFFEGKQIVEAIIFRLTNIEQYAQGGSRFEIWSRYASHLIPLPLGRGYMFDFGLGEFKPHSDFLRLIYSYGIIAAVLFLYICFRKLLRFPLLLVPALMAFSVNSLIDEQKMFALFLSMLGMFYGGILTRLDHSSSSSKSET